MPPWVSMAVSQARKPASPHRYFATWPHWPRRRRLAGVVEPGGLLHHQVGGLQFDPALGQWMLDALVLADRRSNTTRSLAYWAAVSMRSADAHRPGGDQHPPGFMPCRMYSETAASSPMRSSTGISSPSMKSWLSPPPCGVLGDFACLHFRAVEPAIEQRQAAVGAWGSGSAVRARAACGRPPARWRSRSSGRAPRIGHP